MKKYLLLFLLPAIVSLTPQILKPDEHGEKLKQFYLSLNVESLWIAGQHINWETGVADNPDATHNIKTHCSSFTAAACKRLNIYILRPPEHGQALLANAQYDWLKTADATAKGWKQMEGKNRYSLAQDYANKGYVVVAICKNPDEHKPGHTALIMPYKMTDEELAETGPKLIMAGMQNYNFTSLKAGFKHHITNWPEHEVAFYYFKDRVF